jgi:hypothetical protein
VREALMAWPAGDCKRHPWRRFRQDIDTMDLRVKSLRVRTIHDAPSTDTGLSQPVDPFGSDRPMISGAIRT